MMKQGLLWFDNEPKRSLQEKIARATERYVQKFGQQPNICYVNPQTLAGHDSEKVLAPIRIVAAPNILLHHFWVGVSRPDNGVGRERAA